MGAPRLGLLREHDFRQLFVADTISQLGTQVSQLALPLVAVLVLHASNFAVGVLIACDTLAFLLVGRAVVLGSVPVAWALGLLSMPQLYVVGLVAGVLTVFFDVAYQSYLPHLVGRDHLVEGNAKLEAVRSVNQIAGPTGAGFAIQALGAPLAVALDAVSFAGSALFVGLIRKREPRPERAPDARLGREIVEGLRFVLGNRLLRSIAACTGTSNLFTSITYAMVIVLLARDLGLRPATIGLFFSAAAVGGLLGALATDRIARRLGQGPTIWISAAVGALFGLAVPLVQRGWLLWAAGAANTVFWACVVIYNVTQVSFRQRLTPERMLGRMNATMRFLVWGTMPIGSFLGGLLGQYFGARIAVWIGAIGATTAFLPVFASPLRNMRELPTADVRDAA